MTYITYAKIEDRPKTIETSYSKDEVYMVALLSTMGVLLGVCLAVIVLA